MQESDADEDLQLQKEDDGSSSSVQLQRSVIIIARSHDTTPLGPRYSWLYLINVNTSIVDCMAQPAGSVGDTVTADDFFAPSIGLQLPLNHGRF